MGKKSKIIFTVSLITLIILFFLLFRNKSSNKPLALPPISTERPRMEFDAYQTGDIIFQISRSGQSEEIQLATHSKYSHCGIIFRSGDEWSVLEAVQPVKRTDLQEWIERGVNHHYVIKRLKQSRQILNDVGLKKMREVCSTFSAKDYDYGFDWSDEQIYCSELIWKIFNYSFGIELAPLQKMNELDLKSELVQTKLKERYDDHIPLDEPIISPAAIFDSGFLETIVTKN